MLDGGSKARVDMTVVQLAIESQEDLVVVDQWCNGLRLRPGILGVELLSQLIERVLVDRVKLVHIVLQNGAVEEHDKVLDNIWDLNLLVLLRGLVSSQEFLIKTIVLDGIGAHDQVDLVGDIVVLVGVHVWR